MEDCAHRVREVKGNAVATVGENKALVEAGNHDFSGTEKDAEYEATKVEKLDDKDERD